MSDQQNNVFEDPEVVMANFKQAWVDKPMQAFGAKLVPVRQKEFPVLVPE